MATRAYRNNNPGNIRHHSGSLEVIYPVVLQFQGLDDGDNYAKFPTRAKGCAALATLLATYYGNSTVRECINKYAPSDDNNDPDKYIMTICNWSLVQPTAVVGDLEPNKFFDLCKAISRFEGWKA